MGEVLTLFRYQWSSYWRRLQRTGSVSAANQGILLLVLVLVIIKYFQMLQIAATNLTRGNTRLVNSLLIGIFVALLFPLASGTEVGASPRLLHLPISRQKLFLVRLLTLLIPPSSWLIVLASLAICYPLAHAPNQLAAIAAGLLFIVMSLQIGVAAANLLSISLWRKIFASISLILLVVAGIGFRNGVAFPDLEAATRFNPASLVIAAAEGKQVWIALSALALLTVVATCVAFWAFSCALQTVSTRPKRRFQLGWLRLPGRLGGLVAKDFRYFRRLLDPYFGVLASALCCLHLLVAEDPSADVARILVLVVFLGNSAIAFNLFGLDNRSGLNRYTLLPLSGKATVLSKNLAFAVLVAAQLLPIFVLVSLRLGVGETAAELLEAISVTAAYLAWGNWMSVCHPLKLHFYRFSSSGSALADNIGGLIFGSAPGVVAIWALSGRGVPWIVILVTLVSLALCALSVVRFGRRLEQRREQIALALS
jgi:hypothetical protein